MAMTAVAVRMAYWAKDNDFEQWRRGLMDSSDTHAQANVKLADLEYDMPDLPVAVESAGVDESESAGE